MLMNHPSEIGEKMRKVKLTNRIVSVDPESIAAGLGIAPGDRLLKIENQLIHDSLDYQFYSMQSPFTLVIERNQNEMSYQVSLKDDENLGITLEPLQFMPCTNKCIFCFVDQMPKEMRKGLHFKDEDYRLSFLYGNYVTMTNMQQSDEERVVQQGLSPLYVSVHVTDPEVRKFVLGNKRIPDIREQLKRLAEYGIELHTQLVLMPGINDGAYFERSISDLAEFYPAVASIAAIPVGLTKYREKLYPITPPDRSWALQVLEQTQNLMEKTYKELGENIIQAADELYLLAGEAPPSAAFYGDFPQLTNGVGMISLFSQELDELLRARNAVMNQIPETTVITGFAAFPTLQRAADQIAALTRSPIHVLPVPNMFWGEQVTVSGLITGKDIIISLVNSEVRGRILIPDNMLKGDEPIFLDDLSPRDIEQQTGCSVIVCENSAAGLLEGLGVS